MKHPELKEKLKTLVAEAKPLLDNYLNYAEQYKNETEKYVDVLLDEVVGKERQVGPYTIGTVIDANSNGVDRYVSEASQKLPNAKFLFDRKSFKIYVLC